MATVKITSGKSGAHLECADCAHDVKTVQGCADVVASCGEACCGTEGCAQALALVERTFYALASHTQTSGCLAKGFGLEKTGKGKGGAIDVSGLVAANCDTALCTECANVALACHAKNKCIDNGRISIGDDCVKTLLHHALETGCISKGLGHCGATANCCA